MHLMAKCVKLVNKVQTFSYEITKSWKHMYRMVKFKMLSEVYIHHFFKLSMYSSESSGGKLTTRFSIPLSLEDLNTKTTDQTNWGRKLCSITSRFS